MSDSAERDEGLALEARRVDLAPAEMEVIAKACVLYRGRLPVYLKFAQPELALIEGILKKIG